MSNLPMTVACRCKPVSGWRSLRGHCSKSDQFVYPLRVDDIRITRGNLPSPIFSLSGERLTGEAQNDRFR